MELILSIMTKDLGLVRFELESSIGGDIKVKINGGEWFWACKGGNTRTDKAPLVLGRPQSFKKQCRNWLKQYRRRARLGGFDY